MNERRPWQSHQITHRVDGWVIDDDEKRIPASVAEMIARVMPSPDDGAVATIRLRMIARHKKVLGYV